MVFVCSFYAPLSKRHRGVAPPGRIVSATKKENQWRHTVCRKITGQCASKRQKRPKADYNLPVAYFTYACIRKAACAYVCVRMYVCVCACVHAHVICTSWLLFADGIISVYVFNMPACIKVRHMLLWSYRNTCVRVRKSRMSLIERETNICPLCVSLISLSPFFLASCLSLFLSVRKYRVCTFCTYARNTAG